MRRDVLEVDDAHDPSAAQQRDRQEGFEAILGQFVEEPKTPVQCGILGNHNRLLMLGGPTRNALPDLQLQLTYGFRMGVLRGPQHQLVSFQEVHEARVTLDHGGGKINDLVQYVVKWDLPGHSTGDAMQKNHVSAMPCYALGRISANQQG